MRRQLCFGRVNLLKQTHNVSVNRICIKDTSMAVDTWKMTELQNESDLNGFLSSEREKLHVVVCLTDWSRVCRNLKRNLAHLAAHYSDVQFATVDVDKSHDIKKKHSVASVPTWLMFKGDQLFDEVATTNSHMIDRKIQKYL